MKIAHWLIPLALAAVSCEEIRAEDESAEGASGYWERLAMQPFTDAQGMVIVELPFPSTWKIVRNHGPNEPSIIGPHGTKVFDFSGKSFLHTNDPSLRQTYQRVGQPLRAMPGIDALVGEDLVSWSADLGLRYLRHYEIPELSKIDQWYNDQLFRAGPGKVKVTVIGSDWENQNGAPHFLLTHLIVITNAKSQSWFYSCNGMQAEKAHFETVKNNSFSPWPTVATTRSKSWPTTSAKRKRPVKAGRPTTRAWPRTKRPSRRASAPMSTAAMPSTTPS